MKKEERFDMTKPVQKPSWYMIALEWVLSRGWILFSGTKIDKSELKGLEGPFLCLSNHASMIDFPVSVVSLRPHTTTWVSAIEEFDGKEWLFRKMGMIPKRKFTHGTVTAKHVMTAIKRQKQSVTIYPEARFIIGGINERLDDALGKLISKLKVPVVLIQMHGNFLKSPQWCKHPYRDIKVQSKASILITKEEAETLPIDDLQKRVEDAFVYDEYQWQYDNKIAMKSKNRALNIHKLLYKCPHCKTEFKTMSDGTSIWCSACGKKWEMDKYSRLKAVEGETYFEHVPDWYRWERSEVRREVEEGTYSFTDIVQVHHHITTKEMRNEGTVKCVHDKNGFTFSGTLENGKSFELNKSVASMYSLHIDYNFRKKGAAFDIATEYETYFMYPVMAENPLTKLHLATEELYNFYVREKKTES